MSFLRLHPKSFLVFHFARQYPENSHWFRRKWRWSQKLQIYKNDTWLHDVKWLNNYDKGLVEVLTCGNRYYWPELGKTILQSRSLKNSRHSASPRAYCILKTKVAKFPASLRSVIVFIMDKKKPRLETISWLANASQTPQSKETVWPFYSFAL